MSVPLINTIQVLLPQVLLLHPPYGYCSSLNLIGGLTILPEDVLWFSFESFWVGSVIRCFLFLLIIFPLEVVTLYDPDPALDWIFAVVSSFDSQTSSPELSGIKDRALCLLSKLCFCLPLIFAPSPRFGTLGCNCLWNVCTFVYNIRLISNSARLYPHSRGVTR